MEMVGAFISEDKKSTPPQLTAEALVHYFRMTENSSSPSQHLLEKDLINLVNENLQLDKPLQKIIEDYQTHPVIAGAQQASAPITVTYSKSR